MCDATTGAEKLVLLECFHELKLEEISLLGQAGDPATADKISFAERNYQDLKRGYQAYDAPKAAAPTASDEFERERIEVIRRHEGG